MELEKKPLAAAGTVLQDGRGNVPDAPRPGSDLRRLEKKETKVPNVGAGTKTWSSIVKRKDWERRTSVKSNKDITKGEERSCESKAQQEERPAPRKSGNIEDRTPLRTPAGGQPTGTGPADQACVDSQSSSSSYPR